MNEQRWAPVEDGEYSAGKLLVYDIAGRYVVATKAIHDDNATEYWNATTLPNEYRLCRRTDAHPDAATVAVPGAEVRATIDLALSSLWADARRYVAADDVDGFRSRIDAASAWLEQAGGDNAT